MEHSFSCADSAKTSHNYTVTMHRGQEGLQIALHILAMAIEPLTAVVGPMLSDAFLEGGVDAILDNPDYVQLLQDMDKAALARALREAVGAMTDPMIFSILRYTNRDGQPLINAESLRPTGTFDAAYAGNYLEVGKAIVQVCRVNGFFPGLDTSD